MMLSKVPFFVISCFLLLTFSNGDDVDKSFQGRKFPYRNNVLRNNEQRAPPKNTILISVIFVAPFVALAVLVGLVVLAIFIRNKKKARAAKQLEENNANANAVAVDHVLDDIEENPAAAAPVSSAGMMGGGSLVDIPGPVRTAEIEPGSLEDVEAI